MYKKKQNIVSVKIFLCVLILTFKYINYIEVFERLNVLLTDD